MKRWRWAWRDVSEMVDEQWERQKELDACGWRSWERFLTYVAWPFGCVTAVVLLVPLAAVAWERTSER